MRTFNELNYFTSVKTLDKDAFYGAYFSSIGLNNITSVGVGAFATSRVTYPWLPKLTTLNYNTVASSGAFYSCRQLKAIRFDSINEVITLSYNSTALYLVITKSTVPTAGSSIAGERTPPRIYVLNELVSSYRAASNWSDKTIISYQLIILTVRG